MGGRRSFDQSLSGLRGFSLRRQALCRQFPVRLFDVQAQYECHVGQRHDWRDGI